MINEDKSVAIARLELTFSSYEALILAAITLLLSRRQKENQNYVRNKYSVHVHSQTENIHKPAAIFINIQDINV